MLYPLISFCHILLGLKKIQSGGPHSLDPLPLPIRVLVILIANRKNIARPYLFYFMKEMEDWFFHNL